VTVALAMIVKDEADKLERCLDSALPLIDHVVLIDTGSTDNTADLAKAWAHTNKVSLTLGFQEWTNFAVNRSSLLRLAKDKADWLLMLDSDMVLHFPDPLPDFETCDSWHGRIKQGALDYALPLIVRASKPWHYVGVAHSYLACDEGFSEGQIDGLWVEDHSSTTNAKIERDLVVLSEEHARNPLDRRTVFYLAQSYEDLDRVQEAIHFYRLRAEMGGWDEEVYVARYRLGCLLTQHVSFSEAAQVLLKAWEAKPDRIEALRALAGAATSVANKASYPSADKLFVGSVSYQPHDLPAVRKTSGLKASDVSAVIVTRGDVSLDPVLDLLPYDDVVVWNNLERDQDLKILGRYEALKETKNDVVFFVDDDVLFSEHERLLAAYQPGRIVANMDASWVEACGYDDMVMLGAGSVADKNLFWPVLNRYLERWPYDDDFLLEPDFIVGTVVPSTKVDLGYAVREFADADDRLYRQPWQQEAKDRVRSRARMLV